MNTFVSITMRGTTFGIIYNTKLCRQQLGRTARTARTAPPAREAIELLEALGLLREIRCANPGANRKLGTARPMKLMVVAV